MRAEGLLMLIVLLAVSMTLPVAAEAASGPGAPVILGCVRATVEPLSPDLQNDSQAALPQSHFDWSWYGRFGYGTLAGPQAYGGLMFGFGRRIERNAVGIDVLLFSGQIKLFGTSPDLHTYGGLYTHAYAASLATLKGLYVVRPRARTSAYIGGGAGWGAVSFGHSGDIYEDWHGSGAQGELTAGYAFAREATSTRLFVQADFVSPFYRARSYSRTGVVIANRYVPSLVVSIGAGW